MDIIQLITKLQKKIKKRMRNDVKRLYIDSVLDKTHYLVENGQLYILAEDNGMMCIEFEDLKTVIAEIEGIYETYKE